MFKGAIIMAAGEGTRMSPLTDYCPKPFLKYQEKPLIQYSIDLAKFYGVKDIVISIKSRHTNYLNQINGYNWVYLNDSGNNANWMSSEIVKCHKDHWLIMCADIVTDINLNDLYMSAKSTESDFCLAPILSNKQATHRIINSEGKWEYNDSGKWILSGISTYNANTICKSEDLATCWAQAKNVRYIPSYPKIWNCFDKIEDFQIPAS